MRPSWTGPGYASSHRLCGGSAALCSDSAVPKGSPPAGSEHSSERRFTVTYRHFRTEVNQAVAGRFSDSFIQAVRDANDIVDVVGEAVALKKSGKNYLGLCPFHQERTPSFTVSPDKQIFYCFGCQAGGHVINFVMKRDSLSFPEAITKLAERAGVPLPKEELTPEAARRQKELDGVLGALETAAAFYEKSLRGGDEGQAARAYLESRSLDRATIQKFRIGWAPAGWDNLTGLFRRQNIPLALGERASLLMKRQEKLGGGGAARVGAAGDGQGYYDRFRERVMFPIFDQRGRVIAFGGRVLDDSLPKYLNSGETEVFAKRHTLYPLHLSKEAIRQKGFAVLVEGYMDAVTSHRLGHTNVVASLGTALTPEQCRLLLRLAPRVIIAYDADTAGATATLRGLDMLSQMGGEVLVATVPDGKDPDDLLRRHGAEAFTKCLAEAVSLVEYKFRRALAAHDPSTIEGRIKATAAIVPILAALENAVEREAYMEDFARRLGTNPPALRAEVERARRRGAATRPSVTTLATKPGTTRTGVPTRTPSGQPQPPDAAPQHRNPGSRNNMHEKPGKSGAGYKAEEELIRAMIQDERARVQVLAELGVEGFLDGTHREIAAAISRAGEAAGGVEPRRVLDFIEDMESLRRAAEILSKEGEFSSTENNRKARVVADYITEVKRAYYEARHREIFAELARRGDDTELAKQLKEVEDRIRDLQDQRTAVKGLPGR